MSTFALKMIAIITMLIDHIGAVLLSPDMQIYWVFRGIGRLAFPIFVFLLVEGFYHTKDVKKYLIRMGVFALISEIPFDLAFYNIKSMKSILIHQNVFFTLFLGLLLITIMSKIEKKFEKQIIVSNVLDALVVMAIGAIAFLLKTDYDIIGILMIVAFYLYRGNRMLLTLSLFVITGFLGNDMFLALATISMIFIGLYNGKKGRNVKYLFYIFYPAHLLCLYFIHLLI